MRIAIGCALLAAVGPTAAAIAQPLTTTVETVREAPPASSATPAQDMAFEMDRTDRMTVPVLIGGTGPYPFLVDTGADRTAVSSRLAARLALAPGRTATLHSVTGSTVVQTAKVPRLEINKSRVRSVEAALLERSNIGAEGILGVDSLRSERVTFDFGRQLISIVPSTQRIEREDRDAIVIRGTLKRGHLIVTNARVNGARLTVVLDTGSEVTMGNSALRQRLERLNRLGEPQLGEMISVTGQKLVGEVYSIRQLTIGEVTFRDLAIMFSDAPIFGSLGLEEGPTMLLGMNAMRAFDKVSIDFANKKLRMVMPLHSSREGAQVAAR